MKNWPHSISNKLTRDLVMTLILTMMILVSLELLYLSTNALLIRKIKDQAKPHQIRSDLIKPNIGFVEEKFDPYQLL